LLGLQDFGHVASNHPADVDAQLFLVCPSGTHDRHLPSPRRAQPPPWVRNATAGPVVLVPIETAVEKGGVALWGEPGCVCRLPNHRRILATVHFRLKIKTWR